MRQSTVWKGRKFGPVKDSFRRLPFEYAKLGGWRECYGCYSLGASIGISCVVERPAIGNAFELMVAGELEGETAAGR